MRGSLRHRKMLKVNFRSTIVIGESVGEKFEVKTRNLILAAGISTAQISTEAHLPTPPS